MSNRRKKAASRSKFIAYTAAIIIHVAIIAALFVNFTDKPKKTVEAFDADKVDVVKATTVDEAQIKQRQEQIKQQDRDKKRQEKADKDRLKKLREEAEREKQRIAQLQEQQKEEQVKTQELELQRKEIALKKQQEEAKREQERKEREKKIAQQKKREEAKRKEQQRIAAKKKQEAEAAQKRLNDLLAEEERLLAAAQAEKIARERTATVSSKYAALIKQSVVAIRTISPGVESWREVTMNIKLSSLGEVEDVSVVKSSGNASYDRDAETAIRQASPLPIPPPEEDEEAHRIFRDVTLKFKANE